MSTAFAIARDMFAAIGVACTVTFAVVFAVAFIRDRKRQQVKRGNVWVRGVS